jgi:hypothetical protein
MLAVILEPKNSTATGKFAEGGLGEALSVTQKGLL